MLAAKLIRLIESQADGLTRQALHDLTTNPRLPAFHAVPRDELEARLSALYHNLGAWIGAADDDAVRREYEDWGGRRVREGVPISQIVFALIVTKHHLRRFIREHGLVDASTDRVDWGELLPVQLQGIQELNDMVDEFFDRAMYYLASGYEEASWSRASTTARAISS